MYINRALEEVIRKSEIGFKAVMVTGPRQVGKSTILKHMHANRKYITFDDPVLLAETKNEPGLFFRNNKPPIILDEVQYISELFPYIKMECDKSDKKGRFHLTGSQQYHLMKNVSDSLAGRVAVLELSGLSLREMQNVAFSKPFIPTITYIEKRETEYKPCENIWNIIHRGSYPALVDENVDWQTFYSSYVQTYINRDINELGNVKDKLKFTRFLTAMAARSGQIVTYSHHLAQRLEVGASRSMCLMAQVSTS